MSRSRFCGLSSRKRSTNDFLCILKCGCPTPSSGRNLCQRERGCFKWMCVDQVHLHAYITFEDYTIFKNLATSLRNLTQRTPNGINESPEMCFEFLYILIGKSTMAFLTGQSWRVLISWYTGEGPEQGFRLCFADGLNLSLVSSVAQAILPKEKWNANRPSIMERSYPRAGMGY